MATKQPRESIPNLGYAGFLMKKTIQPYSLRQNLSSPFSRDIKDQNMLFFINKKLASIRQRLGTNHIPYDFLMNPCLRIKPQKKNLDEMRKDVYDELEMETKEKKEANKRKIAVKRSKSEEILQKEVKSKVNKPEMIPAGKKISSLLHNVLSEEDLLRMFYQYKLGMRKKQYDQDLSPDFIKTLKTLEENKLIRELSKQNQLDLPRLLGLDRENIMEFIVDEGDEMEVEKVKKIEEAKKLKLKNNRLSSSDVLSLLKRDEKKNVSQSLESFNNTRMENMSLEKNKRKKIVGAQSFFFKLKEKNEALDQQIFQEHLSDVHSLIRRKNETSQGKFLRKRPIASFHQRSTIKSDSIFSLSSSQIHKSPPKNTKFNHFIMDCNAELANQKNETMGIEKNIKGIEKVIGGVSEVFSDRTARLGQDEHFQEFLEQREFKKKLLNHFLEKVIDPQGILSHYSRKIPTKANNLK